MMCGLGRKTLTRFLIDRQRLHRRHFAYRCRHMKGRPLLGERLAVPNDCVWRNADRGMPPCACYSESPPGAIETTVSPSFSASGVRGLGVTHSVTPGVARAARKSLKKLPLLINGRGEGMRAGTLCPRSAAPHRTAFLLHGVACIDREPAEIHGNQRKRSGSVLTRRQSYKMLKLLEKNGCPARIRTSIDGVRVRSLTIRRRGIIFGGFPPSGGPSRLRRRRDTDGPRLDRCELRFGGRCVKGPASALPPSAGPRLAAKAGFVYKGSKSMGGPGRLQREYKSIR
jgi:hypothetical protein